MMEAEACSCDWSGCEPPKVHRDDIRTARKEWQCYECGETIASGMKYHDIVQIYECYGVYHYRTCVPCELIRKNFCAPYGGLREYIQEYLGFDYVTDDLEDDEEEE